MKSPSPTPKRISQYECLNICNGSCDIFVSTYLFCEKTQWKTIIRRRNNTVGFVASKAKNSIGIFNRLNNFMWNEYIYSKIISTHLIYKTLIRPIIYIYPFLLNINLLVIIMLVWILCFYDFNEIKITFYE